MIVMTFVGLFVVSVFMCAFCMCMSIWNKNVIGKRAKISVAIGFLCGSIFEYCLSLLLSLCNLNEFYLSFQDIYFRSHIHFESNKFQFELCVWISKIAISWNICRRVEHGWKTHIACIAWKNTWTKCELFFRLICFVFR